MEKRVMAGRVCVLAVGLLCAGGPVRSGETELRLVPWPKAVRPGEGCLTLTAASRLLAADARLLPLAEVVAGEVHLVTGLQPAVGRDAPRAGDIVLRLGADASGEAYTLRVTDRVEISAGTYRGAAWGTATLLQLLRVDGAGVSLPVVAVDDHPDLTYRGVMSDVARNWVSPDDLRQRINLCRLYKIPYHQLHLTDDQAFTFPSKAFPNLGKSARWLKPSPVDRRRTAYTIEELTNLVAYAEVRGVTLVPELDVPGHSGALRAGGPVFNRKGVNAVDVLGEACYEALDTLLAEMAEVFHSSPYIHLGGDEVNWGPIGKAEGYAEFVARHNLKNAGDIYIHFMARMIETVKRLGKEAILWEGFHGSGIGSRPDLRIPEGTIVMLWSHSFNSPQNLVKHGYRIVNASWVPMYTVKDYGYPIEDIYGWTPYDFCGSGRRSSLPREAPVVGAQMCNWESFGDQGIPLLRRRAAAMSAKTWNVDPARPFGAFARDLDATDARFEQLVRPVRIGVEGLAKPEDQNQFAGSITVSLSSARRGVIRYALDGSEPTVASPAYAGPLALSATNAVGTRPGSDYGKRIAVRAGLFGEDGVQLGCASRADYYPVVPKIRYTLYDMRDTDPYADVPAFDKAAMRVDREGQMHYYGIPPQAKRIWAAELDGTLRVPAAGTYILRVGGKGRGRFLVDGRELFNGPLQVGSQDVADKPMQLEAGPLRFTIQYCTSFGSSEIYLRFVRIDGGGRQYHQPNDWLIPLNP